MTELFEKSIRVLELPQLLERLSQKAVSEAAKERALRLTPSTDADDVRRLQDETDAARALIGLRGSPSFSGVKDVREALARAERGGMLNPRELLTIAGLLTNSRRVREYYEADQGEGTVLDRMFDSLHANRFLEDKITTSILSEDEIADAASPELADIRRHKRAASAKGRQILQKIISSPSYKSTLQEALITQRDGRFVVPVKAECKGFHVWAGDVQFNHVHIGLVEPFCNRDTFFNGRAGNVGENYRVLGQQVETLERRRRSRRRALPH